KSVTTHAFRNDSVQSIRSPDEVPEHGIEAVVRALETVDLELRVRDDLGKLSVECVGLAGADDGRVGRRKLERDDVVHAGEGLRELRSVGHAAAVSTRRPMRRVREADDLQGRGGLHAGLCRRHAIEPQEHLDELLSRQPAVELVLLRTITEAPLQWDVVPRVLAEERDVALVGAQLADEELEQRALPGAVRPDEAGDPFSERRGERVEAQHLAVPLRDAPALDDAGHPVSSPPITSEMPIASNAIVHESKPRNAATIAVRRSGRIVTNATRGARMAALARR